MLTRDVASNVKSFIEPQQAKPNLERHTKLKITTDLIISYLFF